jgi:hypothetical protein
MRISPYLCGEAIDVFLEAAQRAGIPVQAAGLENLEPGWIELSAAQAADKAPPAGCSDDERPLVVLVGDIASSNNVAFTEAYRRSRKSHAELWIAGHDDEVAQRAAVRVIPDVAAALKEAVAAGPSVEVWVNPEEVGKDALAALLAVRGRVRINLLWNSRNAGYLATRQKPAQKKPDLLLDVGIEDSMNATKRILWGMTPRKQDLFIPLPRELWILGRSHPTGMPSATSGTIDLEVVRKAALDNIM